MGYLPHQSPPQHSSSGSFDSTSSTSTLLSTDHSAPDSLQENKRSPVNPKCLGCDPWQQHDFTDSLPPNVPHSDCHDIFRAIRLCDKNPSKRRKTTVHFRSLSAERGRKPRKELKPAFRVYEQRLLSRSESLDQGRDIYINRWEGKYFEPGPAPIRNTVPESIASLWESVAMVLGSRSQDVGTDKSKEKAAVSLPGYAKGTQASVARESLKLPSASSDSSKRTKHPSPYDVDFGKRVLEPREIEIKRGPIMKANVHFDTAEVKENCRQYYTNTRKAIHSSVWLEKENAFVEDIVREYKCMKADGLCEVEFATYAFETILKRDPRASNVEEKRRWVTSRMLELCAVPDDGANSKWRAPPYVTENTSWNHYSFDIRPDCSYWLSLQAFNPEYGAQVNDYAYVKHEKITSPYLTIEFKRDTANAQKAEWQVAAASSVALYNRYCLRVDALQVCGRPWNAHKSKVIRHYGMTMEGTKYTVWVVEPKLTEQFEWEGCEMKSIYTGYLTSAANVRNFIDWINEIHCWGLTTHGLSVEDDVKVCINPTVSGIRVSEIHSDYSVLG